MQYCLTRFVGAHRYVIVLIMLLVGNLLLSSAYAQKASVAIVFVDSGDANDPLRSNDIKQMISSLNSNSSVYNYVYGNAPYFSSVNNISHLSGMPKIVIAHASSNQDGTFSGALKEFEGAREVTSLAIHQFHSLYYCKMDGNNEQLNVDDIGRRISARVGDGYKDVTSSGPIATNTPGRSDGGSRSSGGGIIFGGGILGKEKGHYDVNVSFVTVGTWDGSTYTLTGTYVYEFVWVPNSSDTFNEFMAMMMPRRPLFIKTRLIA